MKKLLFVPLFLMSVGSTQNLWADGKMVSTLIGAEHIFAPKGFDSNDNTQVIVSGYLPNLCYKSTKVKTAVRGKAIYIDLEATKYEDPNILCPQMVVPFLEVASVGVLDKGTYSVFVNGSTPVEKKSEITIVESQSAAVDDFVYANVDYVEKDKAEGSRKVILKGYNPSDCLEMDQVKAISNGVDTYSVLPIMKKVRSFCPMKLVPFEIEWEVPAGLNEDKILLHVRSMGGKSVNSLYQNR